MSVLISLNVGTFDNTMMLNVSELNTLQDQKLITFYLKQLYNYWEACFTNDFI